MDVEIQTKTDTRHPSIKDPLKQHGAGDTKKKSLEEKLQNWLDKKKNALMVVASLIATMGFQIGVNPPGGVWQDDNYLYDLTGQTIDPSGKPIDHAVDSQNKTVTHPHKAGYAVLASKDRDGYEELYIYNTIGFVCSLSVIFLLVSGLPVRNKFFMWILIVILWVAISATATTYNAALKALTPGECDRLEETIAYSLYGWIGLTLLIFFAHVIRLFFKMVRKLWRGLVKLVSKLTWRSDKPKPSAARSAV